MAAADNRYSLFVNWAKIILPLAALALLSTMFLFARGPSGPSDIPYAEIEALARDQIIARPSFSGVADDGAVVTVSAREAQLEEEGLYIREIEADILGTDGSEVAIRAGDGQILDNGRTARLDGLARIEATGGYEMETRGLTARLDTGRITSDGALEARAPYGAITAGQLVIETPEGSTARTLLFKDGVTLVYRPQPEETSP